MTISLFLRNYGSGLYEAKTTAKLRCPLTYFVSSTDGTTISFLSSEVVGSNSWRRRQLCQHHRFFQRRQYNLYHCDF
ncbi:uncharacterized protein OCT59_022715 [Rhizophagus irregularis]|uniref:Uncharacterized protein n=1 Tax=Rhizophagus irregularis TaxID=588596 RepID=A0A916A077_9GLOM|nr:hypothetical protein OCT59_022715 [Rhizophagus irregularis]CAB4385867.1 unnamed protein product [Rhizophagus irregularis]CAB5200915.1 unnamed protein product [Rhizophagus irregularis]CAB5316281.1 unnamed protein product [Rhizophagus irregularis]CAB5394184.1 unnamed protein product [Rhizophagus irregularis]